RMNPPSPLARVGLDGLAARLEEAGVPIELEVGDGETVIGRRGEAGSRQPLPSNVARLEAGGGQAWLPAPRDPAAPSAGDAPIYLVGGAEYVLPTVRLF